METLELVDFGPADIYYHVEPILDSLPAATVKKSFSNLYIIAGIVVAALLVVGVSVYVKRKDKEKKKIYLPTG